MDARHGRQDLSFPTNSAMNTHSHSPEYNNRDAHTLHSELSCDAGTHLAQLQAAYAASVPGPPGTESILEVIDDKLSEICTLYKSMKTMAVPTEPHANQPSMTMPSNNPPPDQHSGPVSSTQYLNPIPLHSASVLNSHSSPGLEGSDSDSQGHGTVTRTFEPFRTVAAVSQENPRSYAAPQAPAPSLQSQTYSRAANPSRSNSSDTSEAYSPIDLPTPTDGPIRGQAQVHRSQSRQPLHPIIKNEEEKGEHQPLLRAISPSMLTQGARQLHSAADQTAAVPKPAMETNDVSPAPMPDNSTKKHKKSAKKPKTSRPEPFSKPLRQAEKKPAVPFEMRATRRRCHNPTVIPPASTSDSSFPLLIDIIGEKGLCKFTTVDKDGVEHLCGAKLVKDAESVRNHLGLHYEQLGYVARRDDMIQEALNVGASRKEANKKDFRAYCPWCQKEPTLFGGLNRHIVEKELKIHGVECPCGGTNSRANQKHNSRRHEESQTHKDWLEKIAKQQVSKRTLEDTNEEFIEGSSKGTKRRRF